MGPARHSFFDEGHDGVHPNAFHRKGNQTSKDQGDFEVRLGYEHHVTNALVGGNGFRDHRSDKGKGDGDFEGSKKVGKRTGNANLHVNLELLCT